MRFKYCFFIKGYLESGMTRRGINDISRMNAEEQFTDLTISSFLKLSIISSYRVLYFTDIVKAEYCKLLQIINV